MNFIEQLLHISPDGGSGATEFFIVAALAAVVFVLVFRRQLLALITRKEARGRGKDRAVERREKQL